MQALMVDNWLIYTLQDAVQPILIDGQYGACQIYSMFHIESNLA